MSYLHYIFITDYVLGCFKSFVRFYKSTIICNISVYLFDLIEISAIRISALLPT